MNISNRTYKKYSRKQIQYALRCLETKMDIKRCCICGKQIHVDERRDPYPLGKTGKDYCCKDCEVKKVAKARYLLECEQR